MRILFALPGFHRFDRGAEVALLALASELARSGERVTVMGSGPPRLETPYNYVRVNSIRRERFESLPKLPLLRQETSYEEATFIPGLLRRYRPNAYDVTVTCSFPFTNLALRRPAWSNRPKHVFVTQNGDWPAFERRSEYRFFGCDGLVCTNPDYFERNKQRWDCALIPNGIDMERFSAGVASRKRLALPEDESVVLMVSALIDTKRVEDGIRAIAPLENVHLVVAGDGPLRASVDALASALLPGRFTRLTLGADAMPDLYRSANVFLHLSKEESFGNVFVEAMASGLPVVGHDSPRLRWIVGDEEFLVDTTQIAAVTDALRRALTMGSAASVKRKQRARTFAWANVAARYRDFFASVIAR